MMRLMFSLVVLGLATVACSASSGSDPSDPPAGSSGPGAASPSDPLASGLRPVTPSPVSSGSGSGSLSAAIVDPIVADAAAKAGVPVSEVVVVSAEAKSFPDGGLGCPLPGMVYPQVIVDGYQVVVQVGQQTFDYRGSAPGRFRLCTT